MTARDISDLLVLVRKHVANQFRMRTKLSRGLVSQQSVDESTRRSEDEIVKFLLEKIK